MHFLDKEVQLLNYLEKTQKQLRTVFLTEENYPAFFDKTVQVMEVGAAVLGHRAFQKYYRQKLRPERVGAHKERSDANSKIQHLLMDTYRANNIVTVYKGGSRIAKNNKHTAKRDQTTADRWWMRLGIKHSKFHQVRRCDYHA